MTNKQKEALKELEEIRLSLFRCAADLDRYARDLYYGLDRSNDKEDLVMYIKVLKQNRDDTHRFCEWDKLKEQEDKAWRDLLDGIE